MILQAWLTLPSCLTSSSRPALARMIFWSLVMTVSPEAAVAGAAQPRPASPPPRLKVRARKDTVRQIKLKLPHISAGRLRRVLAGHEGPGEQVYLVYPSRRHLAPRTRVVIDFVVEQAKELEFQ